MGILRDIFEEKHRIFEGPDEEAYKEYCATLKKAGIRIQASK